MTTSAGSEPIASETATGPEPATGSGRPRPAGSPTGSPTVSLNGEQRPLAPGTTLAGLVATLSASPSGVAAALNETVVPRGDWDRTTLTDGDRVEVLTAVQGG